MKEKISSIWSLVLLISVLLAACVESDGRLDRLFSLHVQTTDLPEGWYREKGGIGDRDNQNESIISRWVQFRGVPETVFPTVLVIHELTDYPTVDQATSTYAEIVKEEFPVKDWTWPEQIVFVGQADQFRLACLERRVDIHDNVDERFRGSYFCTAVGQYGTTLSVLRANLFQDQWLTFGDLQRVLESADARLAASRQPVGQPYAPSITSSP